MTVSELITRTRPTLQDTNSNRWSDTELLYYVNEGLKDIAVQTYYNRIEETLTVVTTQQSYVLTAKVIRFDVIDTNQTYSVLDNQTLYFTSPEAESVDVSYYAYPTEMASTSSTLPIEQDLIEALKYFVLKRCYEKEDSTENFSKATYFNNEYMKALARNSIRWEGLLDVTMAKQDYYN